MVIKYFSSFCDRQICRKKASQPASGLLIMALLAEGFPVRLIPEQPLVSPMRNDVIHHRCRDNFSFRLAESTERMLLQEQCPGFTPAGIIPTDGGTAAHTVIAVHSVILTEHLALFAEPGTPRVAAGSFRLLGHFRTSVQIIKKPRSS